VRNSTKSAVGVITLGILGLSYHFGQDAVVASGGYAAPTLSASSSAAPTPTAFPSQSEDDSEQTKPAPSASSSSSTVPAPKPSASASKSASTAPAPAPQPSASQSSNNTSGAAVTKNGSVIESGFGTVQVQVTKENGKITAINMLQANATHGRQGAFPYLIDYAIAANGSNFANLSGATYTTTAFKQSLKDALAKF
jgi:uncharacterized protein with FMN-binding domain